MFPGHSQILSCRKQDKICEWPGNKAKVSPLLHQLYDFHTNAGRKYELNKSLSGAYSAVGSILARPGQTLIMVSFTVDTKEANRTGTPVPIGYVLHVN